MKYRDTSSKYSTESFIQKVEKENEEIIKMLCDGEYPFEIIEEEIGLC